MQRRILNTVRPVIAVLAAMLMVVGGFAAPAQADTTTTIAGNVSFGTAGSHPAGLTATVWVDTYDGFNWHSDFAHVSADAGGNYVVTAPTTGFARLRFCANQVGWQCQYWLNHEATSLATTFSLTAAPISGKDQTLPIMGSISGHVYLGSSALSAAAGQVKVTAFVCYEDGCVSGGEPTALTDASGNYSFPSMYNGTYTLRFALVSGSTYQAPSPKVVVVSTANTTRTGQDVTMPPAASISGTVYLGSTSTPAGAGQVNVEYSTGSEPWSALSVTTTAGGQYTIPGLPNGSYHLRFVYNGPEYAAEWYDDLHSARESTYVYASSALTGIDAVLEPGSSISGTVTDLAGNPVPDVLAIAKAYYGNYQGGDAYGPEYTVPVGSDGHYSLTGLPEGYYSIRFWPGSSSPYAERRIEVGDVGVGESIVIAQPTRFYSGAIADGYVKCTGCPDDTGVFQPRDEMGVYAETRTSPGDPWVEVPGGGFLGANGYFQLRDLAPGEYRAVIRYSGSAGYAYSTRSAPFTVVEGQMVSLGNITVPKYANAVTALYIENGGAAGALGAATSSVVSFPNNGGGQLQHYANGSIYSSNWYGTWVVPAGPIRDQYFAANSIFGVYKWPNSDMFCDADGCYQFFGDDQVIEAVPTAVVSPPSISGSAIVGGSLTAAHGTYSPAATTFTYSWLRNGVRISGATGASYVAVAADLGLPLAVEVTAKSSSGLPVTVLSAPTAPIGPSAAIQIANLYASNGGSSGPLGVATSGIVAFPNAGGGSLQHFTNGSIYSSNLGGTWIVTAGPIREQYWGASSISGQDGWPSSPLPCVDTNCSQTFTGLTGTPVLTISSVQTVANTVPVVTGIAQVGGSLSVSNGTYTPAATSFTYRWLRNGSAISGATGKTYSPVAADLGQVLTAEVTARSASGMPVAAVSAPTAAVAPTAAAQIATLRAANPSLGAAISAVVAFPNGGGGSLQHFANGSIYSSNVGGTWVVPAGPIRDAYWAASSISGVYQWPTGVQACASGTCSQTFVGGTISASPLTVVTPPSVGGTARVGGSLIANPGSYTPAGSQTYLYSWFRDGVRISGATASTYALAAADEGHTFQVEVTASRTGSVSVATLSSATAAVGPSAASQIATLRAANASLGAAISGVAAFADNGGGSLQHFANGSIYSSNVGGTWVVPAGPIRDAYWAASSIFGAYKWPTGAQDCTGGTCSQTFVGGTISAAPLTVNTPPAVGGTARVGGTLVASPGAYAPAAQTYLYSWFRDGVRINGATASTYALGAADETHTFQVEVTASRTGSVSVTTLSSATAAVGPSAASQIAALYAANSSALGAPTSAVVAFPDNGGGSLQHFTNGSIYSSNVGGTWIVSGAIRSIYWGANSIFGTYKWPTAAQDCTSGTCFQTFVGGTISLAPLTVDTPPSVGGSARVGGSLVVAPGAYTPAATTFTYRWYRDGTTLIAGASAATYVPVAADQGHTLQAEVTAARPGSVSVTTRSGMSASIGPSAAVEIANLYALNPSLGSTVSAVVAFPDNGGGSLQHYQNGSIYSSNVGGTWIVWAGPIRTAYWNANSIFGVYKWPSGPGCATGCTQTFTGTGGGAAITG